VACRNYAFDRLNATAVYSIIRDTNTASQRVAERNGMKIVDRGVRHYKGIDMPHFLYEIER
ncbi:MAG: GNAT family N-acetyltransferase, partial [Victivallaceae bacterium]